MAALELHDANAASEDVSSEDEVLVGEDQPVEFFGHDGPDCGVSPDDFGPEGGETVDSDGDALPDDFVMYPFDHPILEEYLWDDELGCGVAPDGFVPEGGEMVDSDGDGLPDDFVMYPFDPVPVEFLGHDGLDCGSLSGWLRA